MAQSHRMLVIVTLILVTTLLATAGCTADDLVWVDEGTSYTMSSVDKALDIADISAHSDRQATEAAELRHSALTSLRTRGGSASEAANLLTATFSPETRAVPVYVESASLDGKPVLLVVEATGRKTGTLNMKRLWVLGEDGSVILARSR